MVKSSQASISINSCTEMSKTQFFPVIIVKIFLTDKGFFENAEIMLAKKDKLN